MKTHGICHAQSARKHRKAGHLVQELGDGRRYQWMRCGPPGAVYPQMFGRVPSIVRNGRFGKLNGMKPTGVILDEQHSFDDIERVNRAFPIETIAKAFEVPVHMICDSTIFTKGFDIEQTLSGKEYPPAIMGVDPGAPEGDMAAISGAIMGDDERTMRHQMANMAFGPIHTAQRIELLVEGVGAVTIAVGDRYWPKRRNQHSKPYHVLGFMAGTGDVMFCRDGDTTADSTAPRAFYGLIGKRAP